MNAICFSASLRWLVHGSVVLIAFIAGTQFRSSPPLPTSQSPVPTVVKKIDRSVPLATVSGASIPEPSASPAVSSAHTPVSKLSQFIETVGHLNATQTLDALHKVDLRADSIEAKLQRHVLLGRFAELDPETALTYVDNLSGSEYEEQKANVLSTWASRDPAGAAAHFQSNTLSGGIASDEDRAAAASIASEWAKNDPKAALTWSASLPEEVRSEARGRVLASMASNNPTLAVQTASLLPAGFERAEVLQPIAAEWAQSSPTQAASWVQSLPDTSEQASAAGGLVSSWMNTDPMATSQWVSKLQAGPVRDAAISAMVQARSLSNDPEAATLWASSVQDNALREQLVTAATTQWKRLDPVAAMTWQLYNGQ